MSETTNTNFPISDDIWLEKIQTEIQNAVTKEDKQRIIYLFSEAVKDYLSIKLWIAYTSYASNEYQNSLNQMDEGEDDYKFITLEDVRKVFQEACNATNYIIPESHKIWDSYRDFEENILEKYKVQKMYLDRLKIPHSTLEKTFTEYSSFITKYNNDNYESLMIESNSLFNEAKSQYYKRDKYEQELIDSNFALDKFMNYIQFEKQQPKPFLPIIRTLYERAIYVHYLVPYLWEDYIFYLLEKKISNDIIIETSERSTRNCPWSGDLWSHYMRALEKRPSSNSYDEIKSVFQNSLSIEMLKNNVDDLVKVIIANCDLERRKLLKSGTSINLENSVNLKNALSEGLQTVNQVFQDGDPYYRLERYLIEIETLTGNVIKAREIWEQIIKQHRGESEAWIRYIDWEKSLGNLEEVRKKYKVAAHQNTDWPERIFDGLEQFEHQYGTLENLESTLVFLAKQKLKVANRRAKTMEEYYQAEQSQIDQTQSQQAYNIQSSNNLIDSSNNVRKRKYEEDDSLLEKRNKPFIHNKPKRDREFTTIVVTNLPLHITEGIRILEDSDESQKYAYIEFSFREDVPAALTKDKKKIGENEINVYRILEHILYVTNFIPSTDLKELFEKDSAHAALEMNGYEVEPGRKLKVAISNPILRKPRSPPEQREIFIRNLPSEVNSEELESIFNKYGRIIKVRIPTTPDNKCKGIAYMEFDSEENAKSALALNLVEFKGCILNVDLSRISEKSRQVIFSKLPSDTTEEMIREIILTQLEGNGIEEINLNSQQKLARVKFLNAKFNGKTIKVKASEDEVSTKNKNSSNNDSGKSIISTNSAGMFLPRQYSKPKVGIKIQKNLNKYKK
ncbi:1567_t:CDS:10 [Diversispora eburnea]|uniref:1567_t:CDS:1 n=1 Tax=Diversispora eburnea TaxID=1213867 RepID=A0A9N8V392_9GLOM|nr:1567_t:CDS:10 [Diversispora eburnea]